MVCEGAARPGLVCDLRVATAYALIGTTSLSLATKCDISPPYIGAATTASVYRQTQQSEVQAEQWQELR